MSIAEKRHMGKVAAVGCIACIRLGLGETPCHVHHIREGRIARTDTLTIGLCPEHHRQMHERKETLLLQLSVASEFDLLGDVLRRIA